MRLLLTDQTLKYTGVLQDHIADANYQLWLEAQWQAAAAQRGIKEPALRAIYFEDCRRAEGKRVNRQGPGSWPLAYRAYVRAQAELAEEVVSQT